MPDPHLFWGLVLVTMTLLGLAITVGLLMTNRQGRARRALRGGRAAWTQPQERVP
jgi:hypothetical protein